MADTTLQTVSQQFEDLKKRIATEEITALNTGQVLKAPNTPLPASIPTPTPAAPTVPPVSAPTPAPAVPPAIQPPTNYTVQAGDTASGIATKLGIPLSNITGFRSGNPNLIFPGETLTINKTLAAPAGQPPAPAVPVPKAAPAAPAAPAPTALPETFETEVTNLLAKFGIKPPSPDESPFSAFANTYKQLYKDLGLSTVKERIESSTKSIEDLEAKKNEEIAEVNDNPFIAASIRAGQKRRIENKYEAKINALVNRLKLDQSLFESGQEDIQFIAQQALAQSKQGQQLTQDIIFKAIESAQKSEEARRKLEEPQKPTTDIQEFNLAVEQGFQGSFIDYKKAIAEAKREPEGIEPDKLLTVDEAIKLGVPFGTTRGQVKGVQPFTTKQRELKTAFAPARVLLNQIETLSKKVNTGQAGIGRFITGGKAQVGSILQTNPDAALFEAQKAKLSLLVRALGEKGTLATQDVERVRQGLPTLFDSKVVAERKIKELRDFISSVEQQTVQSFGQTEQLEDIFGE